MKNLKIINIGKFFFWLSFILGNVCLFGYIIFRAPIFAVGGFGLLYIGTLVNLAVFLGLVLYAIFNTKYAEDSFKSALILLINIPIAILYAWIGLEIL